MPKSTHSFRLTALALLAVLLLTLVACQSPATAVPTQPATADDPPAPTARRRLILLASLLAATAATANTVTFDPAPVALTWGAPAGTPVGAHVYAEDRADVFILEFLIGGGALATLGAIVYPAAKYIYPPLAVEAKLSQLKLPFTRAEIEAEPKKAKYFKYGRQLGIILITDSGELSALSATCTHLDCTVQHRPDLGIIWCSCHNGRYTEQGANISGPPPRPLQQFVINEVDGTLFVSKKEEA